MTNVIQSNVVQWVRCATEKEWEDVRHQNLPERVSSTQAPVLFGASPWMTPFQLYHSKQTPETLPQVDSEAMRWGLRLQDAIAAGVAADHGWDIERDLAIAMRRDAPMMSSFDFRMYDNARGFGRLEIKNVSTWAWRQSWTPEEAPAYVEIQLQHQLETADDASWGAIVAFVGGNTPVVYARDRDVEVGKVIRTRCARFMTDVAMKREPPPDFARDAEAISELYREVKDGRTVDFSNDQTVANLIDAYRATNVALGDFEKNRTKLRSELLYLMGDAQILTCNGTAIKTNTVAEKAGRLPEPGELIGARAAYRTIRIVGKGK